MAQINLLKIKKINKTRNTIHEKVFSTYTIFEDSGEKYIQIDTYGRSERETPEKVSQSLQFDKETAKFLANLLIKEFKLELM